MLPRASSAPASNFVMLQYLPLLVRQVPLAVVLLGEGRSGVARLPPLNRALGQALVARYHLLARGSPWLDKLDLDRFELLTRDLLEHALNGLSSPLDDLHVERHRRGKGGGATVEW
jgi:hypothetical protein